jgi:hypothetical protein
MKLYGGIDLHSNNCVVVLLYQSAIYEVLTIDLNALRHQRST